MKETKEQFALRMCKIQRENCAIAYLAKDHELHPVSSDSKEREGKAILEAMLPNTLTLEL